MSHISVLSLGPDRPAVLLELDNARRGAPLVWEAMARHHLGAQTPRPYDDDATFDRLMALQNDPQVPEAHRALLAMTRQGATVLACEFARAAAAIRQCCVDWPELAEGTHWPAIAQVFERTSNVSAIGLQMCDSLPNAFLEGPVCPVYQHIGEPLDFEIETLAAA